MEQLNYENKSLSDKDHYLQQDNLLPLSEQEQALNSFLVETFDDADFGVTFAKYCKAHGIKRADGKEIPWKGGMEPGIDYVDVEGNILRLKVLN